MLVIIVCINNRTQGAKGTLKKMLNPDTRLRRLQEDTWVDCWRLYNSNIPLSSAAFRGQPSFSCPNNPDSQPCKSRKSHLSLGYPFKDSSENLKNEDMFHKPLGSLSQLLSLDYCSTLCTACLLIPNQLFQAVSALPVTLQPQDGHRTLYRCPEAI